MSDIVFIEQLKLDTKIGIHDWERARQQPIILDIEMGCYTRSAAASDDIAHCIDYFTVCERLKQLAQQHQYHLVESLAEAISRIILKEFAAKWVKIRISKPEAVPEAGGVGVLIERHQKDTPTLTSSDRKS